MRHFTPDRFFVMSNIDKRRFFPYLYLRFQSSRHDKRNITGRYRRIRRQCLPLLGVTRHRNTLAFNSVPRIHHDSQFHRIAAYWFFHVANFTQLAHIPGSCRFLRRVHHILDLFGRDTRHAKSIAMADCDRICPAEHRDMRDGSSTRTLVR